MKTLQKLIFKEWFLYFFRSICVLFFLISTTSLISGFLRGSVEPKEVLLNFFFNTPFYLTQIFPISCLSASVLSVNKLKNSNELVALFSLTFTKNKYLTTLFAASCIISFLQLNITSYIQPYMKKQSIKTLKSSYKKFSNLKEAGLKFSTIDSGRIWYKNNNYFVAIDFINKKKEELIDVDIYYFNKKNHLIQKIHAPKVINSKQNTWIAPSAILYNNLDDKKFPTILYKKNFNINIKEKATDLIELESDITTLNIISLYRYINRLKKTDLNINEYLVLLYDKISFSLVCIIFTLIGALGIFSPNRRAKGGLGRHVFIILSFSVFYWFLQHYLSQLGKNSVLSPAISSFSIPLFFTIILLFLSRKNNKLS